MNYVPSVLFTTYFRAYFRQLINECVMSQAWVWPQGSCYLVREMNMRQRGSGPWDNAEYRAKGLGIWETWVQIQGCQLLGLLTPVSVLNLVQGWFLSLSIVNNAFSS